MWTWTDRHTAAGRRRSSLPPRHVSQQTCPGTGVVARTNLAPAVQAGMSPLARSRPECEEVLGLGEGLLGIAPPLLRPDDVDDLAQESCVAFPGLLATLACLILRVDSEIRSIRTFRSVLALEPGGSHDTNTANGARPPIITRLATTPAWSVSPGNPSRLLGLSSVTSDTTPSPTHGRLPITGHRPLRLVRRSARSLAGRRPMDRTT